MAFNNADESEDDAEDFIKIRPKQTEELSKETSEYKQFLLESMHKNALAGDIWNELSTKATTSVDDAFLMKYVLNREWIDEEKGRVLTYDELVEVSEEEDHLEEADEFERKHNFRYEEEYA
jgi:protein KRI1